MRERPFALLLVAAVILVVAAFGLARWFGVW